MNSVATNVRPSVEVPYPSPVAAWWMAGIFAFAAFVSYTDRLILGVLVDPIRGELDISDAQVSLLQGTAFAFVYILASLVLGRLADRVRRLNVILAGSLIWCLATIACGFAPTFWSLFACRMVVGAGEAALAPAVVSLIGDSIEPHRRGLAIGLFVMGMVVGGPASIAIGGVLLDAAQGGAFDAWPVIADLSAWRAVLVLAGTGGLTLPLLCLTLREPARRDHAGSDVSIANVSRQLLRGWRIFVPLYAAMALLCVGDYGLLSWAPSLLSRRFELPASELGMHFAAVTTVAGVLGSIGGGYLSDAAERRGGVRGRLMLAAPFTAACVGAALLIKSDDVALVYSAIALWTLASTVAAISGMAAVQSMVRNQLRGVAQSLVAFFNTLVGLGLGPTLVALSTESLFADPLAVGYSIALVVTPAAVLAAALFLQSARAAAPAGVRTQ